MGLGGGVGRGGPYFGGRSGSARRMLVNDPPSLGKLLEDQGKSAPRRFLAGYEFPGPAHEGTVGTEQVDLQLAKGQLAHLAAFRLVALFVALEGGLPAPRRVLAAGKA